MFSYVCFSENRKMICNSFNYIYFAILFLPYIECLNINYTSSDQNQKHEWHSQLLNHQNLEKERVMSKKWDHKAIVTQNLYPPDDPLPTNEDYFASYDGDYGNSVNNFSALIYDNNSENPAIFPNPEVITYDTEKVVTENGRLPIVDKPDILPEVEIPDNSLADGDLKERDLIDSVQYVYFGRSNQGNGSGFQWSHWGCAIPGGCLISVTALILTAVTLLRNKTFRNSKMFPIEMNIISSFMVTNVIMIISIRDTKAEIRCEITALLLHYLHLVCTSWIFVYCYVISDNITKGCIPNLRYNYLFAYGVPAVLVLFFYAISMESYETKNYCWMSLEKGMLLGFMLPGTLLILVNTLFAIIGLKSISKKQQEAMINTIQSYLTQTLTSDNTANNTHIVNLPEAEKYLGMNNSLLSLECISHKSDDDLNRSEVKINKYKSMEELNEHENYEASSWIGGNSSNMNSSQIIDYRETDFLKNYNLKIDLSNLSIDNLSWKTVESKDMSDMKKCLNFALIMQPSFCIFWFMGVVALESSEQVLPPLIFAFLWSYMHWYIFARFTSVLPYMPYDDNITDVEEISQSHNESTLIAPNNVKSTDTIPLLVTKVETTREIRENSHLPDSISTISN